jgi:hypothetical protein
MATRSLISLTIFLELRSIRTNGLLRDGLELVLGALQLEMAMLKSTAVLTREQGLFPKRLLRCHSLGTVALCQW